jgi:hypothetical protein
MLSILWMWVWVGVETCGFVEILTMKETLNVPSLKWRRAAARPAVGTTRTRIRMASASPLAAQVRAVERGVQEKQTVKSFVSVVLSAISADSTFLPVD